MPSMPSTNAAAPPTALSHAAESLRIGLADEVAALARLSPAVLPNDALVASLQESRPAELRWRQFRNDPNYVYVVNWLFQCRGYLRLASEHFDTDLFEIELFELVHPPPVDEMALLLNKVRLALISKVHGKRVLSLAMFETLFRVYFGSDTPLAGPADAAATSPPLTDDLPRFDDLFVDEKIGILAILIAEVSLYPDFREYIDKAKLAPEHLRLLCEVKGAPRDPRRGEEFLLVFDETALYKRTTTAPELVVPKKRKLAPEHPELHYPPEVFDVADVRYELLFKDVYGLDALIRDLLRNKKSKANKALLNIVHEDLLISNVFSYDIKKRKILSGRKKEFEMARLLATRKKSSRIEAKEKQKHLKEQERRAHDLEDLKHAASRRSQRAQNLQEQKLRMDYTAGLSRGERLSLRKRMEESASADNTVLSSPSSQSPEACGEPAAAPSSGNAAINGEIMPGALDGPTPELSLPANDVSSDFQKFNYASSAQKTSGTDARMDTPAESPSVRDDDSLE